MRRPLKTRILGAAGAELVIIRYHKFCHGYKGDKTERKTQNATSSVPY